MGKAFDVNPNLHPSQFRDAVHRVANLAQDASPETVESGLAWYGAVHDAVRSSSRSTGLSIPQGAGVVAAVSPGMDFDNNNIHALSEIGNMRPEHWDMVRASASQPRVRGASGRMQKAPRLPEVRDMLREVVPTISMAGDGQLLKAHAIMSGDDPDTVLDRRSNPKTNSFHHNILDPQQLHHDHVTIDGRAADIVANRMRGWDDSSRGIQRAVRQDGRPTRYEDHEEVYRRATDVLRTIDPRFQSATPSGVQAVTWEHGKTVERQGLTSRGLPRQQGAPRRGQPYVP